MIRRLKAKEYNESLIKIVEIILMKDAGDQTGMNLEKAFLMSYYNVYKGKLGLCGRVLRNLKSDCIFYVEDKMMEGV